MPQTRMTDLARPVELLLPADLSAEESLRRMDRSGTNVAAVVSVEGANRVFGVVLCRGIRAPDPSAARGPSSERSPSGLV